MRKFRNGLYIASILAHSTQDVCPGSAVKIRRRTFVLAPAVKICDAPKRLSGYVPATSREKRTQMRYMSSAKLGGRCAIDVALLIAVVSLYGCGGGSETAESGARSGSATNCLPFGSSCSQAQQQQPGAGAQNDTTAPSTPTGLSGSASSPSQINLGWTASTDNVAVTGYRVYRNGVLLATLGNVTAHQNTGLSASTTYSYTVQAFDAAGNASAQSTAVIVTTPAVLDTVAPSTPTGLVATAVSASRINLSWSASTDNVAVTGYRVFRNGALLATLGNVTAYQDSNLGAGTTYVYTVRAFDAAGNMSGHSAAASATTSAALDTTPPTTPTGLSRQRRIPFASQSELVGFHGQRRSRGLPRLPRRGFGCQCDHNLPTRT